MDTPRNILRRLPSERNPRLGNRLTRDSFDVRLFRGGNSRAVVRNVADHPMKNLRRPNVDATYEPTGPTGQFLWQQQDWEAWDFHAKATLNSLAAKGDARPFADEPTLAPAAQIRLENADGTSVTTKACDSFRNDSPKPSASIPSPAEISYTNL